jgi:multidrug efflux pump subunit AcrB
MIFLLGIGTLLRINRAELPKVDLATVIISTRYPGASPEDVELNVTNEIEDELKGIRDIRRITSTSMENVSFVTVEIEIDASDVQAVKDEIRSAVARVTDLPEEVTETPLITEIKSSLFPILEIGLSGDIPYRDLREIARDFEKKLKDVPGVGSLQRYGHRAREIRVEVSPSKLVEYQIPLRDIIAAVRARNIRATGGTLESYTSEKNVVTLAQFENPLEVGDVVVRTTFDGPLIKVKDLAIVRDDFEDERVMSRMYGRTAISFIVTKSENADIIDTIQAVKELADKESEHLPDGVEFMYGLDQSQYVANKFEIVRWNGLVGFSLVVVILSLFLSFRTAFWVALGIPITLLGTVTLLPAFDVDLDGITLSSMIIVMGIIVDDAIIISENIFRRRERGDSAVDAAVNGLYGVYRPVLTTILTTFVAFAPMFFMPGMLGRFVFVIPLTVSLALFISLFEAFCVLPAHLVPGLKRIRPGGDDKKREHWFDKLIGPFKSSLRVLLKLRYAYVIFSLAFLAGSAYYAKNYIDFILFPSQGSEAFMMRVEMPIGSSLKATSEKTREFEKLVAGLPEGELSAYVSRTGAFADIIPMESENYSEVAVKLTPFSKRERTADEIVEDLRRKAEEIGGYDKLTFIVDAGGPPVGMPVTIRVVGPDDEMRARLADSVEVFLESFDGVKDIDRDDKLGKEQVRIMVDHDKLSRFGLTVADIAQNVRTAYDGTLVTSVRYGDEDVDFRVILRSDVRGSLSQLRELRIPNRAGRLIPLNEVAWLGTGPGPSNFFHYDGVRAVTVTSDVDQEKTTPLKVTQAVEEHFDLAADYPGMRFVVGGEAQETSESMRGLFIIFGLAGIGIYFLLILLFDSVIQPLLVMLSIPFGIIGIIVTFGLHGQAVSFLAMLGMIGMTGVVVNDSLVLVNHINELRERRPDDDFKSIVVDGTANRLRPVVLTTLTTAGGLLPLAYGVGGVDVYMSPMALALGYGLVFAMPLTLGLVPCLFLIGGDFAKLFRMGRGE